MDKRTTASRTTKVVALSGILLAVTATSAFARYGNGNFAVSNENVNYAGYVKWNPNAQTSGSGHGGMVVSGNLYDTKADHWVYASAKVSGYGYTRLKENHNGNGTSVYDAPTEIYDPAATYVTYGYVKACQDDAFADTCSSEYMHR